MKKHLTKILTFGVLSCPVLFNSCKFNSLEYSSIPEAVEIREKHFEGLNLENILFSHRVNVMNYSYENPNLFIQIKRESNEKIYGKAKLSENLTFRYLPDNFSVEVIRDDEVIWKTDKIENRIIKTILVDRDKRNDAGKQEQTLYMIEGDSFNPFGNIVDSSLVSTGKAHRDEHPGNWTHLGYYYIQRKKEFSYNRRFDWKMPFALWYGKNSGMREGQNGIHGYGPNTPFGREASHGCVREPESFAKINFEWAEVGTPVIIIGEKHKAEEDSLRFDFDDYFSFQNLIKDLEEYKKRCDGRDHSFSILNEDKQNTLKKITPLILEMREQGTKKIARFENSIEFRLAINDYFLD